jgi:transcriptional regulator with XRE-family HTH domain
VNLTMKLWRLMEGMSRAGFDRRAGLPLNTIANIINKGAIPRLDTAKKIADSLGVSLDWLANDEQDWPPLRPALSNEVMGLLTATEQHWLKSASDRYHGEEVVLAASIRMAMNADSSALRSEVADVLLQKLEKEKAPGIPAEGDEKQPLKQRAARKPRMGKGSGPYEAPPDPDKPL